MLPQTAALFLDAYRELNAKKMFWITLILSAVVVVAFATVTIDAQGFKVLWFKFPSIYNTTMIPASMFFKYLFSHYGVVWWLDRIAIVLALVSTAGIIPDFIAGGAVDLYLSKPISRLRLFLTKYVSGLLFVALQVTLFTFACFVLIGLRTSSWDFRVFYAIPIALLTFSFLFCVCVLLGVLTQSTVASLLLTILFWLLVTAISLSTVAFHASVIAGRIESEAYQRQFAFSDIDIARLKAGADKSQNETDSAQLKSAEAHRHKLEEKKLLSDPNRHYANVGYSIFKPIRAALPKTGETSALLVRWLNIDTSDIDEEKLQQHDRRRAARFDFFPRFGDRTEVALDDSDVLRELMADGESEPATKIIGSSLLFELVILTFTCWIFARRDY